MAAPKHATGITLAGLSGILAEIGLAQRYYAIATIVTVSVPIAA